MSFKTQLVCQCQRASTHLRRSNVRQFASQSSRPKADVEPEKAPREESDPEIKMSQGTSEPGAMSRRLQEATEEALFTGGAAGKRSVQDAGFSEELKEKLLDKIADANFKQEYSSAFAEKDLTPVAGDGTKHIATAQPWSGEETMPDAVLRMLDDAKKPLSPKMRGKYQPPAVDTRIKRMPAISPGQKVASARDRASLYASMGLKQDKGLSDKEREELKKEFRSRFEPAARPVPTTISGLAALANERVEEAIARGQFKDLPRGKALERDHNASNPFVDTTEYLMNRIIQRQDIVPPWIEKQQDLVKAANAFRSQLRSAWKRHASRMIAAKGGMLEDKMARAEEFAAAERLHNPQKLSGVTNNSGNGASVVEEAEATTSTTPAAPLANPEAPLPLPFRDPDWEKAEHAYLKLSVENLNSITRSYNLMAPELAKKPYYILKRELEACFADVAPLLAKEIKDRATQPRATTGLSSKPSPFKGGIIGSLGGGEPVRIYENTRHKPYGFKEWWSDVWKKN